MRSPILFQPLEKELEPVLPYLKGRVLNAGCGDRDISPFLLQHQATAVDNCDRKSTIPGAILCDLVDVPRDSNSYDSILCNAVLEHVQYPDRVMQELHRLLKPGGVLVVGVPFMQPYHPKPDYRRYSREGLVELGTVHGLQFVSILPVHTLAQTITWISWCYLGEKRARFTQALVWVPFYLWNLLSQRTDFGVTHQANGYQIVLQKAGPAASNGNGKAH